MMKITKYYCQIVCVLLGLTALGGVRGFAADIQFTSFDKLATNSSSGSSSATPNDGASIGPFLEEGPVHRYRRWARPGPGGYLCPAVLRGGSAARARPAATIASWVRWAASGSRQTTCSGGPAVRTFRPWLRRPRRAALPFRPSSATRTLARAITTAIGLTSGCGWTAATSGASRAKYFDLTGRPTNYDSGLSNGYTDDSLTPFPLVRPFVDNTGTLQNNPVAVPTQYVGRVTVDASDYIQSAGLWFRYNLRANEWAGKDGDVPWTDPSAGTFRLDFIGGYRFMRMIDSVNIRDDEMYVSGPVVNANNWTLFTNIDNFRAVNNFDGGELGLDMTTTRGRWSLDVTAKAALGVNNQDVQLYSQVRVDQRVVGGGITHGRSAERVARNVFSWIPALTLTGGYQLTDHVKFTVGYDVMYWSAVARAGSQIPVDPATGYPLQVNTQTFAIDQTWFGGRVCGWAER